MNIQKIEKFFNIINNTDIKELCWEKDNIKIKIKRNKVNNDFVENIEEKTKKIDINTIINNEFIISKSIGIFRNTNNKFKKIDLKIGDRIKKYQILGFIETINIFKEITSDYEGIITKILINSGDKVEYGQKLFMIEIK